MLRVPARGGEPRPSLSRPRPPLWGWIVANAVAWAAGMVLPFVGMDLLPWARGGLPLLAGILAVCGGVGLVVGAIHGRWDAGSLRTSGPRRSA